jgi:hypothetical protein
MTAQQGPQRKYSEADHAEALESWLSSADRIEQDLRLGNELAEDLRQEVAIARQLQAARAALEPASDFLPASQIRLLNKIEAEEVKASRSRLASDMTWSGYILPALQRLGERWRRGLSAPLAAAVLTGLVLLIAAAGLALAAQSALPGEQLYPAKQAVEQSRLALSWSAAGDAALEVAFAQERLEESEVLASRRNYEQMAVSLQAYQEHMQHAVATLESLAQVQPGQAAQTRSLVGGLPQELTAQAQRLDQLARLLPAEEAAAALQAQVFTETAFSAVSTILPALGLPTPAAPLTSPTPTPTPSPTMTPLPTLRPSATPSSQPTEVPPGLPSAPAADGAQASPTAGPTKVAPTAVPSETTVSEQPAPTATRKPTNTPRPTPDSRPTKKPKPPKP